MREFEAFSSFFSVSVKVFVSSLPLHQIFDINVKYILLLPEFCRDALDGFDPQAIAVQLVEMFRHTSVETP